jgi:hypothetical protein
MSFALINIMLHMHYPLLTTLHATHPLHIHTLFLTIHYTLHSSSPQTALKKLRLEASQLQRTLFKMDTLYQMRDIVREKEGA